jgi:hypothetical protein
MTRMDANRSSYIHDSLLGAENHELGRIDSSSFASFVIRFLQS